MYFGILIVVAVVMAFWSKPAKAANEYLQYGGGHCQSATLEPYIEKTIEDSLSINGGDSSYNNNSDRDSLRFGLRLSIPLGSTCTKKYKRTMMTNELLKQQLEMLKLCARYQGLELGDEFAEVRRMCAGVRKAKEENKLEIPDKE
jgi:hypothetical protein|tara:strand:- start:551 stop:985 length:435 start_codon:yes stop_codon:yes gene_type:complete